MFSKNLKIVVGIYVLCLSLFVFSESKIGNSAVCVFTSEEIVPTGTDLEACIVIENEHPDFYADPDDAAETFKESDVGKYDDTDKGEIGTDVAFIYDGDMPDEPDDTDDAYIDTGVVFKIELKVENTYFYDGDDSDDFEIKITPESLTADSYEWQTDNTYPDEAIFPDYKRSGKPKIEYSSPSEKKTNIKQVRWFAPTGNKLASVDGTQPYYDNIKCKVIINGEEYPHTPTKEIFTVAVKMVNNSFGHVAAVNPKLTPESDWIYDIKKNGSNKYYLVSLSIPSIKRPTDADIVVYPSEKNSQFHDKVYAHEKRHVTQWESVAPWKDLFNVNVWYQNELKNLRGDSEVALKTLIKTKVVNLTIKDAKTANQQLVNQEKDAWTVQNAKRPYFLNQTMAEVQSAYVNKKLYPGVE